MVALARHPRSLVEDLEQYPPLGLVHDRTTDTLCAIDTHGDVRRAGRVVATLDPLDAGGIAVGDDALFVARGAAGIVRIDGDGTTTPFAQLEPGAWRLGVTCVDAVLYATQFERSKFGAHDGSIVALTVRDPRHADPSMAIDGFHEPIGIVRLGRELVVADARARTIVRVQLGGGRGLARFQLAALPDRPTAICGCGDDSVIVASPGHVRRLWLDGRERTLATGSWVPRAVTADDTHVYVAADGVLRLPN
ncbi:MAG: hypothetical protein NT062_37050 [Proteobacteria bacterium]|nr:hypothetical protein [Pseudomonadota bacterium]